mmetsp:Transcript_32028/g.78583  ORF Transcript_32028/g.78583 Transcript_32028/m.78583 type:complete len:265 (-) Transcript_32028:3511-4305(-)
MLSCLSRGTDLWNLWRKSKRLTPLTHSCTSEYVCPSWYTPMSLTMLGWLRHRSISPSRTNSSSSLCWMLPRIFLTATGIFHSPLNTSAKEPVPSLSLRTSSSPRLILPTGNHGARVPSCDWKNSRPLNIGVFPPIRASRAMSTQHPKTLRRRRDVWTPHVFAVERPPKSSPPKEPRRPFMLIRLKDFADEGASPRPGEASRSSSRSLRSCAFSARQLSSSSVSVLFSLSVRSSCFCSSSSCISSHPLTLMGVIGDMALARMLCL